MHVAKHILRPEDASRAKRRRRRISLVPISIAGIAALYFRIHPSVADFLLAGAVSVLINIALVFYYVFRDKDDRSAIEKYRLCYYVVQLFTTFATFYVALAFIVNGFCVPGICLSLF